MILSAEIVKQFDYFTDKKVVSVTPISGGLSNHNYRVDLTDCVVLFRIFGGIVTQSNRYAEFASQQLACHLGVAPEPLVHYEASSCPNDFEHWCRCNDVVNNGVMITQFYHGVPLTKDQDIATEQLIALAENMATLHAQPTVSTLNLSHAGPAQLDDYWQLFTEKNAEDCEIYAQLLATLSTLHFEQDTIIHGDLNRSNLLIGEHGQCIVDWEFSVVGDRYFDLATVVIEFSLSCQDTEVLLNHYTAACAVDIDRSRLRMMTLYYVGLCWLWQGPLPLDAATLESYQQRYKRQVVQLLGASANPASFSTK